MGFYTQTNGSEPPYNGFWQLGSDIYFPSGGGVGAPDPQIPNIALELLDEYGANINISAFDSKSYRDSYNRPLNPNLFHATPAKPFFGLTPTIPFWSLSYQDRSNWGRNAFLPRSPQSTTPPFINTWILKVLP